VTERPVGDTQDVGGFVLGPLKVIFERTTAAVPRLDFLAALIVRDVRDGDTFHTEYLNLIPITSRESILNAREAR